MSEQNNKGNQQNFLLEESKIQLKDGTVLNLFLNGTEFESNEEIPSEVLNQQNLEDVYINDERVGKMFLNSQYPYNGGTRFSLRVQTKEEKELEHSNAQLTQVQVALAEVYELILGTTGGEL